MSCSQSMDTLTSPLPLTDVFQVTGWPPTVKLEPTLNAHAAQVCPVRWPASPISFKASIGIETLAPCGRSISQLSGSSPSLLKWNVMPSSDDEAADTSRDSFSFA